MGDPGHDDALVDPSDEPTVRSVIAAVRAEQHRTDRQIESLETTVASIIDGQELVSTDDEHDPDGSTIAYERAQAIALLRQARVDREALDGTLRQLADDGHVRCVDCGNEIPLERIAALPSASRCVGCAS